MALHYSLTCYFPHTLLSLLPLLYISQFLLQMGHSGHSNPLYCTILSQNHPISGTEWGLFPEGQTACSYVIFLFLSVPIGLVQLRLLKQSLRKYYQIWIYKMTNCNMPPEKFHTHLLVILTSMDGEAESFYRLPITWANIVKDQFGVLESFSISRTQYIFIVTDSPVSSSKTLLADIIVFQMLEFLSKPHFLHHINYNLYSLNSSDTFSNTNPTFSALFTL